MRTVSTILALVLFGPVSGAEPVRFEVTNRITPVIVVTNRIPATTAVPAPAVAVRPFHQGQYYTAGTLVRPVAGPSSASPATTGTGLIRIAAGTTVLPGGTRCVTG